MRKIGDDLAFHNQLFLFAMHNVTGVRVNVEELFGFVGDHFLHNSDGNPVSEWRVPIAEVADFLTSRLARFD